MLPDYNPIPPCSTGIAGNITYGYLLECLQTGWRISRAITIRATPGPLFGPPLYCCNNIPQFGFDTALCYTNANPQPQNGQAFCLVGSAAGFNFDDCNNPT